MTDFVKENKEKYKISVIVPVFRVEKYLRRCVDSIINQTYKNLEIILVDDGSDDGCPEICDSYAKTDERVRVIHQKNSGLSTARNSGLDQATGEYISLVDSDDFINCHMYEDMIRFFDSSDSDIVMCDYSYYYEDGIADSISEINKNVEVEYVSGIKAQYIIYESYEKQINFTVAWNKLYKRDLFDGIRYPDGRIHEDEARTHQILYRARKIAHIKYPYYYYFQRKDSIVGCCISEKNIQLLAAYADKLNFYNEKNEYELWKKEAQHSMHMSCYQQTLFDKEKMSLKIRKNLSAKKLEEAIKGYSSIKGISFGLRLEILLFICFPDLYYKVWKSRKG